MNNLSRGPSENVRYHALDSLRACMMLLGVWFHASCPYTTLQIVWPYKDPSTSAFLNAPLLVIHVFRMPIFFALAGFFARFSWERGGTKAFLRNRAQRILLPFVIGWPILWVVTTLGYAYAASLTAHVPPPWLTWDYYRGSRILPTVRTMHLWFLYYLIYLYPLFATMAVAIRRYVPLGLRELVEVMFRKLVRSPWRPIFFALPTCAALYASPRAVLENDWSFLIQPKSLLAYAIFFAFGWLLFRQADLLPEFRRHAWKQVLLALALSPLYFVSVQRTLMAGSAERIHLFAAATGSLDIWLFVFGITGLFVRYLDRRNARMRYMADASYWIYLVHLPLLVWMPLAFRSLHWPALAKFTIVLALSVPMLLASYEWFVRRTLIGRVLNGARRRLPVGEGVLNPA